MKKTLTINLSGLVFNIDEDAYQKLKNYLDSIAIHFANDIGKEEIIADIENRFAEEFNQKRTGSKEAITLEDVESVMKTLGSIEDFSSEKNENAHAENAQEAGQNSRSRRLYRDTDNAMLGGVAAGIANYFGTDTVWIRILFVVFTFAWGFAIPLYILLWIITPKAETAAQRAEMKGEPLTIKAIEEHVKTMVAEGKEKLNSLEKKNGAQRLNGFFREVFVSIKNLIKKFFSVFGSIIGFFLSLGAFIAIVSLAIGSGIVIVHRHSPNLGINIDNFISQSEFFLSLLFLGGVFFFPLFAILMLGVRLMKKRPTFNGYVVSTLVVLWAVSLSGAGILASKVIPQIERMESEAQKIHQGNVQTIHPEISDFSSLKISGSYEVEIKNGETFSLAVSGYEKDLQRVQVENMGSTFTLSEKNIDKFCFFCDEERLEVILTAPTSSYTSLELQGANTVVLDPVESEKFTLLTRGVNQLEGNITTKELRLEQDGASKVKLQGTVESGYFILDGASKLEAFDLDVEALHLEMDGAAKANITVESTLEGKVDGVSKLEYRGTPQNTLLMDGAAKVENITPEPTLHIPERD